MIEKVYSFLWGDLIRIPLPEGSTLGISLLILLLIPTGIYFTIRTKLLPIRLFPDMVRALSEKKSDKKNLSAFQTLIVSTATRVGMGNLVGVVAAISAGGAGAVFWMWITALIGSSTAFIEATLAQLYKEKDPLYGGYRGGPAYYIHRYWEEKQGRKRKKVLLSVLFAISGLICWCGISQVISNSVTASFKNAFDIPPLYTTIVLVVIAAVIVLRKNATVKVLDILVPVMAVLYFVITLFIIFTNLGSMPGVFKRIFEEAFGFRQAAAGGFGVVLMNGVKRGLFSNEAGSGSAPCAAAAAECDKPVKAGLTQALGVFVDTIVICTLTALVILCSGVPIGYGEAAGAELTILGFTSTYGSWVSIFTAVAMCCFAFSTIIGWGLYGTRCIEFLFGTKINKPFMVLYSLVAIVGATMDLGLMWNIAETFNGLMVIPNLIAVFLLSGVVVRLVTERAKMYKRCRLVTGR
mgnify:CR=1 FL=1